MRLVQLGLAPSLALASIPNGGFLKPTGEVKPLEKSWLQFKAQHSKRYSKAEDKHRFQNFVYNLERIEAYRKGNINVLFVLLFDFGNDFCLFEELFGKMRLNFIWHHFRPFCTTRILATK